MTSSVAGPSRSSKALPKTKLAPKIDHGHCLVVCCLSSTTAFWIPLHLRSMPSKLMWCTENCSACSWYWPTEWAHFCKTACYTTHAAKVEWIGLRSFASPTIFTWPLANGLPFLQASWQLFAEKMFPQPVGGRKCFPRAHQILKHGFFATGVNKFVSLWQKYVDCNGSYFD